MYRLTLVKAWNTDEIQQYAELVSRGNPDFIEVKGVTFCGESKASDITMANIPWHEEVFVCVFVHWLYILSRQVVGFVQKLADMLEDYEIACEHEHSNCVLIAHKKVG